MMTASHKTHTPIKAVELEGGDRYTVDVNVPNEAKALL